MDPANTLGNAVLYDVLSQYNTLARENAGVKKKERPILVLGKNKELQVVKHRSSLSLWTRIKAYFGYGSASLNHVMGHLREKKIPIIPLEEVQDEYFQNQSEMITGVYQALIGLDEKSVKRNAHHSLVKIETLLSQPIPCKRFAYGHDTTYHPNGQGREALQSDRDGILDFSHVFPEIGAAFVADGVGHGKPEKRDLLAPVWEAFKQEFVQNYREAVPYFTTPEQAQRFLTEELRKLYRKFEDGEAHLGGSTFAFSMVITIDHKKYLFYANVGDGSIFHVSNRAIDGHVPPNQADLASLGGQHDSVGYFEVHSGDRIFGLSDGVTDFLNKEDLEKLLSKKRFTNQNFAKKITNAIVEKNSSYLFYVDEPSLNYFGEEVKQLTPTDSDQSDDVSGFFMEVP